MYMAQCVLVHAVKGGKHCSERLNVHLECLQDFTLCVINYCLPNHFQECRESHIFASARCFLYDH